MELIPKTSSGQVGQGGMGFRTDNVCKAPSLQQSLRNEVLQTYGCQGGGEGEGWFGSLGLVDANYYI